jgi:hypothetical protein
MGFHKILSTLRYGITKCKTKQIDDVNIIPFSNGMYSLVKNASMNILIHSYIVNGVG